MIRSPQLTLIYQLSDYVQNSTKITAPKKKQEKKIEFKFKPKKRHKEKEKEKHNV